MKILQVDNAFMMSVVAAVVASTMLMASFLLLEPTVTHAVADDVAVHQTITAEISITIASTSLSMDGTIAGITGGQTDGETDVLVITNNSTGYNMNIQFASATAMYRNTGGADIPNYNPAVPTVPDGTFAPELYAQFAYSAWSATDGGDIDPSFLDTTGTCGSGTSADTTCWMSPSSTAGETIVNRTTATPAGGATTTVQFRVDVPNNPVPAVDTGTYTATATLTAVTN